MEITREKSGDFLIVRLNGSFNASWCNLVEQALAEAVREGEHRIRLDMARVDYISSAGLRVIVIINKQLAGIQGSLSLLNPSSMVRSVLSMVNMDSFIESGGSETLPPPTAQQATECRTHTSPRAGYDLFPLPGKGIQVSAIGDASRLHGGPGTAQPIRLDRDTMAIGIGALGVTMTDCAPRFGEFLAVGGVSVFQPADGSNHPDFMISEGTLIPEGHLLLGLTGRGGFSTLARFQTRNDACTVGLGEIAATALEIAGTSAAVVVAIAETAGLVGAALRQSPALAPANNFDFPQIRDWLSFAGERAFRDTSSLVVGVVAREGSPLQPLLRPLAPGTEAHFHAASFSYRPLQKGRIELNATLSTLFEGRAAQAVLHLLHDTRELTGAGESEFLRGALWIAPVLP